MLQHGANLFESHARKPLHKLRRQCAIFKIFEQCCDRRASTSEHPGTTHTLRIALNYKT